jgi:hypothetical protein
MSAPSPYPHSSKNEAGCLPESISLGAKHQGNDDIEGDGDLSQDPDQEPDPEYATSFGLIIIMSTLSLSTMIAALDLVSTIHT